MADTPEKKKTIDNRNQNGKLSWEFEHKIILKLLCNNFPRKVEDTIVT